MTTDPTPLYRLRDGILGADLLIVAAVELDLFSWLAARDGAAAATVAAEFELAPRPVDVMLTYLVAVGLLERRGDQVAPTEMARDQLVSGSPYDLRAYYASLRERPSVIQLRAVLATGEPASWASVTAGDDWLSRLGDPAFAASTTAAMDARGHHLGPRLASAIDDVPPRGVLGIGGRSGTSPESERSSRSPMRLWRRAVGSSNHDTHINDDKTGPLSVAAYSDFMMHATPGKCWSLTELAAMLDDCGFVDIASRHTACDRSVVLAHKSV